MTLLGNTLTNLFKHTEDVEIAVNILKILKEICNEDYAFHEQFKKFYSINQDNVLAPFINTTVLFTNFLFFVKLKYLFLGANFKKD